MTIRYEDAPGVRWTHLKAMGRSPQHYQHALREKTEMTTALKQGIAFHHMVLTPEAEPPFVEFTGGARRGKAWDEFEAANASKVILTSSEMEPVIDWMMAVASDRNAQELLERMAPANRCGPMAMAVNAGWMLRAVESNRLRAPSST